MPWSAADMAKKGARRPELAARVANEVLKKGELPKRRYPGQSVEVSAIRIALAQSNKGHRT